jgi:antagonist of KipI
MALDPSIAQRLGGVRGIPPEGTTLGAIQVTPDGSAVVLGPDRPVTGGYAKPALVAEVDIGEVARLRPGNRVRFQRIGLEEALALASARRSALGAPGRPR